ncbi:MAG: UDP-3-O-acyl-N-acetylglucosamine deacetylase, partial [Phycisphaerales bacterium]
FDAPITLENAPDQAEIPIMDGSAREFVRVFQAVGIQSLADDTRPVRITAPIAVHEGDATITIEPAERPHYTYRLEYPNGPIPPATAEWDGDRRAYIEGIAPARTFCLEHEAQAMRDAGLFGHLSYRDMLVIGDDGPIENEYRFPDECARHKLLDLIGDLALVGGPLIARVTAVRSGHALAHRAARAIVDQSQ